MATPTFSKTAFISLLTLKTVQSVIRIVFRSILSEFKTAQYNSSIFIFFGINLRFMT